MKYNDTIQKENINNIITLTSIKTHIVKTIHYKLSKNKNLNKIAIILR